jgi:hypothetical protein
MVGILPYFFGYYIAVALIAIMLAASGIMLGLGYATDDKKLKELGKAELIQSIINGVIVGSLLLAFGPNGIITSLISGISSGFYPSSCTGILSGNSAICFAYNYLVGINPVSVGGVQHATLLDSSITILTPLALLYTAIGVVGSLNFSIGIVGFSFAKLFSPVLSQLGYMISAITFAILGIEVQAVLLKFIGLTAIPILLPVGMVLRTFYFTRRLGGALIAVAIGLFVVYPLTYLLDAQLTGQYTGSVTASYIGSAINSTTGVNGTLLGGTLDSNSTGYGILGTIEGAARGMISELEALIGKLIDYIALLIVEVFFLPTFSVILTVISTRELARALGSEISFGKFDIF